MSDRLVWLPFDPADLKEVGPAPDGLRLAHVPAPADPPEGAGAIEDVELWVPPYDVGSLDAGLVARMTSLQVVQTLSAGVDAVRDAVPDGVTLCNGRGIHDASTSELAVTLTLAALRDVPGFVRHQDEGEWQPDWRPALADSTVVVVGAGSIGEAIRARLLPFETEVVMVASHPREASYGPVRGVEELPALLPDADVVVLVVPLTEQTRGLVDATFLGRMKDGALLVNVARGPVVVTDDLLAALGEGRVRAALDVTDPEPLPADHPLWRAPGVLVTPHVGGLSDAMWPRARRLVHAQLTRFAAGEEVCNVVTGAY